MCKRMPIFRNCCDSRLLEIGSRTKFNAKYKPGVMSVIFPFGQLTFRSLGRGFQPWKWSLATPIDVVPYHLPYSCFVSSFSSLLCHKFWSHARTQKKGSPVFRITGFPWSLSEQLLHSLDFSHVTAFLCHLRTVGGTYGRTVFRVALCWSSKACRPCCVMLLAYLFDLWACVSAMCVCYQGMF